MELNFQFYIEKLKKYVLLMCLDIFIKSETISGKVILLREVILNAKSYNSCVINFSDF